MAGGNKGAVFLAIIGNGILTIVKTIAFIISRSPALMSEAIHSFADTANQLLLFVGIRKSERPADARYHWGYGGERFFYALLSAVGIFVLGCGVTVYHGISSLRNPPDLDYHWLTYAVLLAGIVIDGIVLMAAVREVNAKRDGKKFWAFVASSSDPTLLAVLFEDAVATLGCMIALVGITLAQQTGNPAWDAGSSIIIGAMLGMIAIWLVYRNRQLILGPAIPKDVEREIREFLLAQPSIEGLRRVRTRIVASDRFALAAEIDYDGRYLGAQHGDWLAERIEQEPTQIAAELGAKILESLAREIDRIEKELQAKFPKLKHLDLESDINPDVTGGPAISQEMKLGS
jgi:zinc transporter 9